MQLWVLLNKERYFDAFHYIELETFRSLYSMLTTMETHRSRNQPTSSPHESLNVVESVQLNNPYELLNNDMWNEIFPVSKEPGSTQVRPFHNAFDKGFATGAVNTGYIDNEEPIYTAVIGKAASWSAVAEEEVYDCINDIDSSHDDQLLIPEGGQHSARSLPDIPLPTGLHDPRNIGTRTSILQKIVSRRTRVLISAFVFSVLVLVVFLAVYIPKSMPKNQNNETIGTFVNQFRILLD